ncbi:MAG: glycosyltransferase family 4 protein [Caulobacteraceae bacterium]
MNALPPNFTLLQVTPALNAGGVEQTTIDIARAVTVAGGRALVASAGGRLEGALADAGGELIRMRLDTKSPFTMIANALALKALIVREKVSLVHVRSRAPAFSALWAARRARVPVLATYHGVYNARSPLKRWYNAVMTRGDLVIANSAFTHDHVIAEHRVDPARVETIPRGVNLARFDPAAVPARRVAEMRRSWGLADDDTRQVVLCAGRLTRWKGQGLLVSAAAHLEDVGEGDFVLIFVGDDQGRDGYRRELQAAIVEAGIDARIVGHCADMPAAYLAADIVCAPSLDPEAFGRTAVEPQIMGRPVLAARHGAATETVVHGETGWLVEPRDDDAWAAALGKALAKAPEKRAAMGERGRARAVELYSVEVMAEATLAVYRRLLAGRA